MRDTDADWTLIAETNPYYGVLTSAEYKGEELSEEAFERFYKSGRDFVDATVGTIRRHIVESFAPASAIDFGCGVGRLALAMQAYAPKVYGVDVAQGMLDKAGRAAQRLNRTGLIWSNKLPSEPVDWVNSFIVFQHIPPERGILLLSELLRKLRPGGVATVHLTAFRSVSTFKDRIGLDVPCRFNGSTIEILSGLSDIPLGGMMMYDYDWSQVLGIFVNSGLKKLWLQHTDHGERHGFHVFGQKA